MSLPRMPRLVAAASLILLLAAVIPSRAVGAAFSIPDEVNALPPGEIEQWLDQQTAGALEEKKAAGLARYTARMETKEAVADELARRATLRMERIQQQRFAALHGRHRGEQMGSAMSGALFLIVLSAAGWWIYDRRRTTAVLAALERERPRLSLEPQRSAARRTSRPTPSMRI
jgi:hypothetical protein